MNEDLKLKRPAELFDLSGKVAVVRGGARGIGEALSWGLASAGADVVIASRNLERCEEVATDIAGATGRRRGRDAGQCDGPPSDSDAN